LTQLESRCRAKQAEVAAAQDLLFELQAQQSTLRLLRSAASSDGCPDGIKDDNGFVDDPVDSASKLNADVLAALESARNRHASQNDVMAAIMAVDNQLKHLQEVSVKVNAAVSQMRAANLDLNLPIGRARISNLLRENAAPIESERSV